jgi:heterodisulfide reductase subunit C
VRKRTSSSWDESRRVKRQPQIDFGFADDISAIPGGERLRDCIQCGTCSAVCPMSAYMDYTPRRLIAMTRAGMKDEVLGSFSIWVCASCYACTAACPKQIPITDMMYALKRTAIHEGVHPKRFATPVLAKEFVHSVDRWGRNTESRLAASLYLKTRPMLLLEDAPLGGRLRRRGRMGLRRESIRHRAQFKKMLQSVEAGSRRAGAANGNADAGSEGTS